MNTDPDSLASPKPSSLARWRTARRLLLGVAAVATLIALFYTVENWRGERAWDRSRRALEARGEVLDWDAYIPPVVPDDQNFYKAPRMREWFVREHFSIGGYAPSNPPKAFVAAPLRGTDLVLGELEIVLSNNAAEGSQSDPAWRFADPGVREQAAIFLTNAIGPALAAARSGVLVARPMDQFKTVQLLLLADAMPTLKELTALFPTNLPSAGPNSYLRYLRIEPGGSNIFRITLKGPVYTAADYLASTDSQQPDFDLLRKAIERPYARIDCDYQQPFQIAIPNFVMLRNVEQTLAERAQCWLLLGQPEAAWKELTLGLELCQILEAKPSRRPLTLVGAMIEVAITGLHVDIIADGLRLHAWRGPQLVEIERRLGQLDLLAPVVEAFREERAATSRTFEKTPRGQLVKLFDSKGAEKLGLNWMPRGWFYQNMAFGAQLEQQVLDSVDLTNRLLRPQAISEIVDRTSGKSGWRSPYRFMVSIAMPNFAKALQTAAFNQTFLNEARLGCALERYRLAFGQYPDSLAALTPQFIDQLPHDLIGGQPLKYRPEGGRYALYSVGWNGTDDGGLTGQTRNEGDWVWDLH